MKIKIWIGVIVAALISWSAGALPLHGGASTSSPSTPIAQFLATLSTHEWGQPSNANSIASNIYFGTGCAVYGTSSCTTTATDYTSYPAGGLTGAQVATDNAGASGTIANWIDWNGAAYDTSLNRIIQFGGGHNGQCGNEGYAFDIANLNSYRMRTPSDSIFESIINVASGSYNNSTGVVTLTLSASQAVPYNLAQVTLTGTGVTSLNGTQTAISPTSGTTFTFQVSSGLGTITITGGTINLGCLLGDSVVFQNGDGSPLHNYTTALYLPHDSCTSDVDGDVFYASGAFVFLLDLSKGKPYTSLPTTLGAPGSGWSSYAVTSPFEVGSPTAAAYDPSTCRIYMETLLVGGVTYPFFYFDLGTHTFNQNQTGPNCGLGFDITSGTARTGHGELWFTEQSDTLCGVGTGNIGKVRFSDGTQTVWSSTNIAGLPTNTLMGICYAPTIDKMYVWGGGNTIVEVDATAQTDTLISASVAPGVTMPAGSDVVTANGAQTRMVCDEQDDAIVVWFLGSEAPFILKMPSGF